MKPSLGGDQESGLEISGREILFGLREAGIVVIPQFLRMIVSVGGDFKS